MTGNRLERLFENLARWRHLPSYQLERRADVFFSAFLPDVVAAKTGTKLHPIVVPELPILCGLVGSERNDHTSVKVDYMLTAADRRRIYLVELKTDDASRCATQDAYLERARDVGIRRIVEGILTIVRRTDHVQKYVHLCALLDELGFMKLPAEFETHLFPVRSPHWRRWIDDIEVTCDDVAVETLYVQPSGGDVPGVIDFPYFAGVLAGIDDPLAQTFRAQLDLWRTRAGTMLPRRHREG